MFLPQNHKRQTSNLENAILITMAIDKRKNVQFWSRMNKNMSFWDKN